MTDEEASQDDDGHQQGSCVNFVYTRDVANPGQGSHRHGQAGTLMFTIEPER